MRIAAVGDIHGHEHLAELRADLEALDPPDLFLTAGDLTDHNRVDEFVEVVDAVAARVSCPILGVFGNNEYTSSHEEYRRRCGIPLLDDDAHVVGVGRREVRIIGSTGSLDRPTWWQRTNVSGIARTYDERVARIDKLLDTEGFRVLLTHYPPTHATMGGEKEEWRPELGSKKLEAVILRRRPDIVVHGHVHKGIPFATLATGQRTVEDFNVGGPIPVYNVAYPVTRKISVIEA